MSRSDDGVVSTTVDIASYGRVIKALFHFISFHSTVGVTVGYSALGICLVDNKTQELVFYRTKNVIGIAFLCYFSVVFY